ncbi:MAG TPA: PHP-associated domain-containing protein [Ktedonobacteraceae bacterium]|jgi:predicted metal-dependent phosphoesterase TrpH|nr:PHP-associated domain-containing protein [Ktedonobacteraceae bacterium]
MANNIHEGMSRLSSNASSGTAMLRRRRQMTQQQAHSTGKLGRADLHMHSTYSDGMGTVEQILDYVEHQTSLDVIALTDHDVIEGALRARDLWAQGRYRFDFIVGEEISTREGHMLALFIEKRIPPRLSIERSIELVHEQGGLAIVAHPLNRIFRHSCQREVLDRIVASKDVWLDGIETWNASFCGIYANRVAMSANREVYGWPELGNSDAHTLKAIGRGCTWFEGRCAQDVRTSIEARLTAPGGKLWRMNDYLALAGHHINKQRQRIA